MAYYKRISIEEASKEFQKLKNQIKDLMNKLGDECDNIEFIEGDLDQEFMKGQYRFLLYKLEEVYRRLKYLSYPVTEQGFIKHNHQKRYALPSGTYLTSGSVCEILVNDEEYGEQYWVYTTIEHNGEDYYATALGRDVSINGMMVRVRG
jgi:hypothetical protein